jgi:hypothetical protein
MPHVVAWCGFLGAWLLVAGPLDQAVREIEETGFEHEALEQAKGQVEEPPPVSNWWLLRHGRESVYRHLGYQWPEWAFWFGVIGMLVFCVSITVGRTRRRHHRPAVED